MSRRRLLALSLAILSIGVDRTLAHDGNEADGTQARERTWTHASGLYRLEGSFVARNAGQVQVRTHQGELVQVKLEALSDQDRAWVESRTRAIERLNTDRDRFLLARNFEVKPLGEEDNAPEMMASFKPFAAKLKLRWDDDFFYVESNGLPDHQMMVGITSWQQQYPLPQDYTANNAWRIPLHPVVARNPISARNHFLRGAIALAPNGVPIFNPLNNRGDDALLFGELDTFGGHCGRADDYHYHITPVHLEKTIGKGLPVAYALDGYPIYGYLESDGSPLKKLDAFNGHDDEKKGYHYHASKTYPYLNGGFHGEVTERGGQVDPQPRAEPIREAGEPLRGARITEFSNPRPGSYSLTYELRGRKYQVNYTIAQNGAVTFESIDSSGKKTTETYQKRARGPGNRPGGGRPDPPQDRPRPDDGPGPPPGDRRPPPNPLMQALDLDGDGEISKDELEKAPKSLRVLDRNQDGKISEEEARPEPPRGERPVPRGDRPPRRDRPEEKEAEAPGRSDFGSLVVTSPAFKEGGMYPAEYTCDGAGVSPPIEWSGAPAGTKSFALNVWHVPGPGDLKSYWVVYNIPANVSALPRNSQEIGTAGLNDKRFAGYDPMCSQGPGAKTYHITVYALSREIDLSPTKATRAELLKAIADVTLAQKTLTYRYERAGRK